MTNKFDNLNMETWTERARRNAKEISNSLKMTFEDGNNKYMFSFNDLNAYSYGSGCPDFDLFADMAVIKKGDPVNLVPPKLDYLRNQALGNSINSKPRESIPFGKEYYEAVYPRLEKIVEEELRVNNEDLIEGFRRVASIYRELASIYRGFN